MSEGGRGKGDVSVRLQFTRVFENASLMSHMYMALPGDVRRPFYVGVELLRPRRGRATPRRRADFGG
jgi:hypothetical protein